MGEAVNRTRWNDSVNLTTTTSTTNSSSFKPTKSGLIGTLFPAVTGTTVKVQGSRDGSTWGDIYDETGSLVEFTSLGASPVCWTLPIAASPYKFLRFVFTTAQVANRTIYVFYMG